MAAITDVTLTAGVPTAGSGTVTTLDKFNGAVGTPTSQAITVQGNASGTAIPVSLASVPSHAVTNAGTFAVQATLAAETTKVIGTVNLSAAQTLATVTTVSTVTAVTAITNALPAGTNLLGKVDIQLSGVAASTGSGVMGTGVQRVALATDSPGVVAAGTRLTPPGGTTVMSTQAVSDMFGQYETVAAGSTAQAMGATGAAGDYLAYVTVFPGTAGCGVVTILDNATTIGTFAGGGTTALPSLVPFTIQIGMYSVSGAWKITTGANVTAVGVGAFT